MSTFSITNAIDVNDLNTFRSTIERYGAGLAQSCRFIATVHTPLLLSQRSGEYSQLGKDMSFLCEQAEFPGRAFTVNENRHYGPSSKYPVQTTYTDLTLNFIVRDKMLEKEYFDDWMQLINPNDTYDFRYKKDYVARIDIIQYSAGAVKSPITGDNKSIPTYKVTMIDAFPIAIAAMGLVWGEENFHRVAVTFSYNEIIRASDPTKRRYDLVETNMGGKSKMVTGSILGSKSADFFNVIHSR